MNANSRRILVGGALVILLVFSVTQVLGVRRSEDRLRNDRRDLSELTAKIGEMNAVSDAPKVAALEIEPPDRILNRINAALTGNGLSTGLLANQTPGEPIREGKTEFKIRKTEIELKPATLSQIAAFCDSLKDESTGSVVRDLRLYDPKLSGTRETWKSQMTLTQVIFSPKSDP